MIVAVIPARAGSKGVPGKNVRDVCGHPLLAYTIEAAMQSTRIDRVLVSTDAEDIAGIGRAYGAEAPFLRPAHLATDSAPDGGVIAHATDWLEAHGATPTLIVHLRPTLPLRDPAVVDRAIEIFAGHREATSLRSAHEAPESPYKWFVRDEAGFFQSFRNPDGVDYANLPRQLVPEVFVPDGYVDVLSATYIKAGGGDIHGPRILGFASPSCREIDTPEDLEFIRFQVQVQGHPLLDALNARMRTRV